MSTATPPTPAPGPVDEKRASFEREALVHLEDCPPCGEHFDFERLFLDFLQARCRARGAPPDLKRRILRELFDE